MQYKDIIVIIKFAFLRYEAFREELLFQFDLELGAKPKQNIPSAARVPFRFSVERTNPSVYGSFLSPLITLS